MPKTLFTITLGPSFGHQSRVGPHLLTPARRFAASTGLPAQKESPRPLRTVPTFNSRAWSPAPCKTEISLTAKVDEGAAHHQGWYERFAIPIAAEVAFLAVLATTYYCRCRWGRGRYQFTDELVAHAITTKWLQARALLGGGAISGTPKD